MKVETTRFGDVEVDEGKIISIRNGLVGFAGLERYFMMDHSEESPFKWLQSVDNSSLAFVVIDPAMAKIDFQFEIPDDMVEELGIEDAVDVAVMVVATIPDNPADMTVNLRAPLLINSKNLTGCQLVLSDDRIPVRYPILEKRSDARKTPANCST